MKDRQHFKVYRTTHFLIVILVIVLNCQIGTTRHRPRPSLNPWWIPDIPSTDLSPPTQVWKKVNTTSSKVHDQNRPKKQPTDQVNPKIMNDQLKSPTTNSVSSVTKNSVPKNQNVTSSSPPPHQRSRHAQHPVIPTKEIANNSSKTSIEKETPELAESSKNIVKKVKPNQQINKNNRTSSSRPQYRSPPPRPNRWEETPNRETSKENSEPFKNEKNYSKESFKEKERQFGPNYYNKYDVTSSSYQSYSQSNLDSTEQRPRPQTGSNFEKFKESSDSESRTDWRDNENSRNTANPPSNEKISDYGHYLTSHKKAESSKNGNWGNGAHAHEHVQDHNNEKSYVGSGPSKFSHENNLYRAPPSPLPPSPPPFLPVNQNNFSAPWNQNLQTSQSFNNQNGRPSYFQNNGVNTNTPFYSYHNGYQNPLPPQNQQIPSQSNWNTGNPPFSNPPAPTNYNGPPNTQAPFYSGSQQNHKIYNTGFNGNTITSHSGTGSSNPYAHAHQQQPQPYPQPNPPYNQNGPVQNFQYSNPQSQNFNQQYQQQNGWYQNPQIQPVPVPPAPQPHNGQYPPVFQQPIGNPYSNNPTNNQHQNFPNQNGQKSSSDSYTIQPSISITPSVQPNLPYHNPVRTLDGVATVQYQPPPPPSTPAPTLAPVAQKQNPKVEPKISINLNFYGTPPLQTNSTVSKITPQTNQPQDDEVVPSESESRHRIHHELPVNLLVNLSPPSQQSHSSFSNDQRPSNQNHKSDNRIWSNNSPANQYNQNGGRPFDLNEGADAGHENSPSHTVTYNVPATSSNLDIDDSTNNYDDPTNNYDTSKDYIAPSNQFDSHDLIENDYNPPPNTNAFVPPVNNYSPQTNTNSQPVAENSNINYAPPPTSNNVLSPAPNSNKYSPPPITTNHITPSVESQTTKDNILVHTYYNEPEVTVIRDHNSEFPAIIPTIESSPEPPSSSSLVSSWTFTTEAPPRAKPLPAPTSKPVPQNRSPFVPPKIDSNNYFYEDRSTTEVPITTSTLPPPPPLPATEISFTTESPPTSSTPSHAFGDYPLDGAQPIGPSNEPSRDNHDQGSVNVEGSREIFYYENDNNENLKGNQAIEITTQAPSFYEPPTIQVNNNERNNNNNYNTNNNNHNSNYNNNIYNNNNDNNKNNYNSNNYNNNNNYNSNNNNNNNHNNYNNHNNDNNNNNYNNEDIEKEHYDYHRQVVNEFLENSQIPHSNLPPSPPPRSLQSHFDGSMYKQSLMQNAGLYREFMASQSTTARPFNIFAPENKNNFWDNYFYDSDSLYSTIRPEATHTPQPYPLHLFDNQDANSFRNYDVYREIIKEVFDSTAATSEPDSSTSTGSRPGGSHYDGSKVQEDIRNYDFYRKIIDDYMRKMTNSLRSGSGGGNFQISSSAQENTGVQSSKEVDGGSNSSKEKDGRKKPLIQINFGNIMKGLKTMCPSWLIKFGQPLCKKEKETTTASPNFSANKWKGLI